MKKVFMSIAIVAMMAAFASCGNNAKKGEASVPGEEEVVPADTLAAPANTIAAPADTAASPADSVQ